MLYKNTFKILFSNGGLIWRVLLFLVCAFGVLIGLGALILMPIHKVLVGAGFFVMISDAYYDFLNAVNLKQLFVDIVDIVESFFAIIVDNIGQLLPYIIIFILFVVFVCTLITRFYTMSTTICVNYYMNSNTKVKMSNNIFASFGKNIKYLLAYAVTVLPINLIIYGIVFFMLGLFELDGLLFAFAPFLIILTYTLLASLKTTLFGGWLPAIVCGNKGAFASMKKGFVVPKRRFWQTFGNSFALYLTIIFLNFFVGLLTFGVGLSITIPATCVTVCIFGLVSFYMATGQKYYVDSYNVIAPKTKELTDKFENHKYIV